MYSLSTNKTQSWLSWFLRGVLVLGFLFLGARIFELQIIKGNYYQNLSDNNRIRRINIPAPRGKIIARGGEVLVGNTETKKNIDDIVSITEYKRNYVLGSKFAHVSGYLGEVGSGEVKKVDPDCIYKGAYKLGQMIGRSGLEEKYNCLLSGVDGEELIEVDTFGKKIRSIGRRDPIAGVDIKTTIDFTLQQKVAESIDGQVGAVVATDSTGQILALYSSPSFDPDNIASSLGKSDLPFFDRAISGTYHPGSVFKPIVALAALEEGLIDKKYVYNDEGKITVNGFDYNNWYFTQYGGREGEIELTRALARSTDTFFYKIGEMLGANKITQWSRDFGLDKQTGVDLIGESSGLVPSPSWKKKVKKEAWFLGNTYHFSIGQGDLAVTPIEINTAITAIANKGKLCRPYVAVASGESCSSFNFKNSNIELVREGMEKACATGGTAYTFFDWKHETVACKTGTAQVGTKDATHAWFTMFYPSINPDIVLTVLVEEGGEGSKVAGPIARKIMDAWYLQKNP